MNESFFTKFIQVARNLVDFDNQATRTLPLPQEFKQKRIAANESIYSLLVVFQKNGSQAEMVSALGAMGKALADYSFAAAKFGLEVAVTVLAFISGTGEILLILTIILFVMIVMENDGKITPSTFLVFLTPLLSKFRWGAGLIAKLKELVKMPTKTAIDAGTRAASKTISNMAKANAMGEAASAGQPLLSMTMASKMTTTGTAIKTSMNAAEYSLTEINISKAMGGATPFASQQLGKCCQEIMNLLKKALTELKLDEKMRMLVDTIKKLVDDFVKAWQKMGETQNAIQQKVSAQARAAANNASQSTKAVRPYVSPYSPQNVDAARQMVARYKMWN